MCEPCNGPLAMTAWRFWHAASEIRSRPKRLNNSAKVALLTVAACDFPQLQARAAEILHIGGA